MEKGISSLVRLENASHSSESVRSDFGWRKAMGFERACFRLIFCFFLFNGPMPAGSARLIENHSRSWCCTSPRTDYLDLSQHLNPKMEGI
jgi:hypothetical protein